MPQDVVVRYVAPPWCAGTSGNVDHTPPHGLPPKTEKIMDEIQSFSLLLYFDQILLHIFSKIVFFPWSPYFFYI